MPHGFARMFRGSLAVCRHTAGAPSECQFSVAHRCLSSQFRDYAEPNPTWTHHTKGAYDKFINLCKDGGWTRLPSYRTSVYQRDGMPVETDGKTRPFRRNIDQDGLGFEHCIFYNKDEMRAVCIFQPGPYLEGPPGYAHGGSIATIIDVTVGYLSSFYSNGRAMTANLNIDYRSPIPLGSTVIIDSRVEKLDGRKIYTSCRIRSHDDTVLHNEATGLFIMMDQGEAKL